MKILVTIPEGNTKETFLTEHALSELRKLGEVVETTSDHQLSEEEICAMGSDAEIILCGWGSTELGQKILKGMPDLKLIAYTGGSSAGVIAPEILQSHVQVVSGNNVFAKSVAEGCLAYTLCALRQLEYYMNMVREGNWHDGTFSNRGLIGKKVGLVGFGTIAKYYAELLRWFDVELLIYSSYLTEDEAAKYGGRLASLEEIFSTCDVVSVHSALNDKNRGLVSRKLMEMLNPDALLVNTSRGEVVDEAAMEELLIEKRFSAALDVFSVEPIPPESKLRELPNVVLIPHMGGPTIDMREYVTLTLIQDIERFLRGEPLENSISPKQLTYMSRA